MNFHIRYRPDIDGLRAVAVSLVIAFHAFPARLLGGFTGVDVFFVISGFLISKIIFVSLRSDSFSFLEFYQRRINRIFPALIAMLVAVAAAGYAWLSPKEFLALGQHIAAGAGFVSNLLLFSEVGYFDATAVEKPLLHLWSLGVEEQFYIFWPLLMFLGWRYFRRHFLTFLIVIALLSFASSLWLVAAHKAAAFYLPTSRFWELLLGSALSCRQVSRVGADGVEPPARGGVMRSVGALAGIVLIAVGAALIHVDSAFPGWWALLPSVGAVLVIASGSEAVTNKWLLGSKPFVFIGKISYPLYLWHWPLLSFVKLLELDPISGTAAAIALSVVLATLTYWFIEAPVRTGRLARGAMSLSVAMVIIGTMGWSIIAANGLAFRFKDIGLLEAKFPSAWRQGECSLDGTTVESYAPACSEIAAPGNGGHSVALWGDSHAAHYYPGFLALQKKGGALASLSEFTTSSCPPLLNFTISYRPRCAANNLAAIERIREVRPDTVVLAGDWMDKNYDMQRMRDTVEALRAAGVPNIVLVGTVPRWPIALPRYIMNTMRKSQAHNVPERLVPIDNSDIDRNVEALASELGILYFSPKSVLCNSEGCLTYLTVEGKKVIVGFDTSHLTDDGALPVAKAILEVVEARSLESTNDKDSGPRRSPATRHDPSVASDSAKGIAAIIGSHQRL